MINQFLVRTSNKIKKLSKNRRLKRIFLNAHKAIYFFPIIGNYILWRRLKGRIELEQKARDKTKLITSEIEKLEHELWAANDAIVNKDYLLNRYKFKIEALEESLAARNNHISEIQAMLIRTKKSEHSSVKALNGICNSFFMGVREIYRMREAVLKEQILDQEEELAQQSASVEKKRKENARELVQLRFEIEEYEKQLKSTNKVLANKLKESVTTAVKKRMEK